MFTGNVVAVQGDSTMNCTTHDGVLRAERATSRARRRPPRRRARPAPTTARSRRSIARARSPSCRRPRSRPAITPPSTGVANKIFLIGNATLSDGPNVTRGERIVYDLNTGVANVETKPGGRVKALFVPGSNADGDQAGHGRQRDGARPSRRKPATN